MDAVQCIEAKTIATDPGFINIERGDWVICGEGGECYVVDDAFGSGPCGFLGLSRRAARMRQR